MSRMRKLKQAGLVLSAVKSMTAVGHAVECVS